MVHSSALSMSVYLRNSCSYDGTSMNHWAFLP